MNKRTISIFLFTLLLLSCGRKNSEQFLVSEISNLMEKEVYLIKGSSSDCQIDTIKVRNGQFEVVSKPKEREPISLYFPKSNHRINFFGDENSSLKISGDMNHPETIEVEGDTVNNRIQLYRKSIAKEIMAIKIASLKSDTYWQNNNLQQYEQTLFTDPSITATRESLKKKTFAFISRHSSSPEALIAVADYIRLTSDYFTLKNWWSKLPGKEIKDFASYLELKRAYKQSLLLESAHGLTAFQLYNQQNKPEYLSLHGTKKTLLLFWNSCDKYSSYLNSKFSNDKSICKNDSIEYAAVSLDDSFEVWSKASQGLNGKQLWAQGGCQNEGTKSIGVSQTPVLLLLDKMGKVIKISSTGENPLTQTQTRGHN